MRIDISKTVGGAVSGEVDKLLEVFSSNSESIESNFTSLRQRIDELEQNVIGAIKEEKHKDITALQD